MRDLFIGFSYQESHEGSEYLGPELIKMPWGLFGLGQDRGLRSEICSQTYGRIPQRLTELI